MKFLHVIEQNDICNLVVKKIDIANRMFSYNRNTGLLLFRKIIIITMHVQFLNN